MSDIIDRILDEKQPEEDDRRCGGSTCNFVLVRTMDLS